MHVAKFHTQSEFAYTSVLRAFLWELKNKKHSPLALSYSWGLSLFVSLSNGPCKRGLGGKFLWKKTVYVHRFLDPKMPCMYTVVFCMYMVCVDGFRHKRKFFGRNLGGIFLKYCAHP